jgi:GGDEF domain-containing protein
MDQMLDNPFLSLFAAFVALNTLVYVGLTLARLVPWPRPFELTYVAERNSMLTAESDEGLHRTLQDHLNGGTAVAQIAKGLLWLGLVALAVAAFEVWDGGGLSSALIALALSLASLAASLLLNRQRVPLVAASWLWVAIVTAADTGLIIQAGSSGDSFRYAFALVIMAGYGTLCWNYVPLVASMAIQISVLVASLYVWPSPGALQWILAALTAGVAGVFMVNQRRRSATDVGMVMSATDALGLRDPRTGVWTPRGIQEVAAAMERGVPEAGKRPVCVIVDFPNLASLGAAYGTDFADDIMEAALRELAGVARSEGIVARLSPSRVMLISSDPDVTAHVNHVLTARLGALGLGKASIEFTVVSQTMVSAASLLNVISPS